MTKSLRHIILCAGILLFAVVTEAQNSEGELTRARTKASSKKLIEESTEYWSPRIQLEQSQFISSSRGAFSGVAESSFTKVSLGLNLHGQWEGAWSSKIDGQWTYSEVEKAHYFNVPEFSLSRGGSRFRWTVGRSLRHWSAGDEEWQVGYVQPRYMWSKLRPEQNGLLGVFADSAVTEKLQFTAFVSNIYVPDFGPQFKIEKGSFVAPNPWFFPPVSHVTIANLIDNQAINYELKMPKTSDVIFQPSIGMRLRRDGEVAYCQVSVLNKPMNQIFQSVDVLLRVKNQNAPPGADVYPRFKRHWHGATECGVEQQGPFTYWGSFAIDRPEEFGESDIPAGETHNDARESTNLVLYGAYDLLPTTPGLARYYLSYYKLWGGETPDRGDLAASERRLFESRFRYFDAVKVGFSSRQLSLANRPLTLYGELIYDSLQKGATLVSGGQVHLTSQSRFYVKADLLGLLQAGDSRLEKKFIDLYKANDELSLGYNYEF